MLGGRRFSPRPVLALRLRLLIGTLSTARFVLAPACICFFIFSQFLVCLLDSDEGLVDLLRLTRLVGMVHETKLVVSFPDRRPVGPRADS